MIRALSLAGALAVLPAAATALDLTGYVDPDGAITVQRGGDTVDPYFALQALLLAHQQGLDISPHARRWAHWLAARQKPDATFDRFCRRGPVWGPCKTADADDALLALWIGFLDVAPGLGTDPAWKASRAAASASLARLLEPRRQVYLVSPVYQHGLLIDNLEIWSTAGAREPRLARGIQERFWDADAARYLVSTQPEQASARRAFYPDAVAQVFPLLVRFPRLPGGRGAYYAAWMQANRADWLRQVQDDFAWGLIAIVAWQERDAASASCWMREVAPYRHGVHWTVTDEVAYQILAAHEITPGEERCA